MEFVVLECKIVGSMGEIRRVECMHGHVQNARMSAIVHRSIVEEICSLLTLQFFTFRQSRIVLKWVDDTKR